MSLIHDNYDQFTFTENTKGEDIDYDDIGALFDINDLQSPVEDEGQRGSAGILEQANMEEVDEDEADQNDWMKVFVPSLLMAGFPRQHTSPEFPYPMTQPISHESQILPATSTSIPLNLSDSSALPLNTPSAPTNFPPQQVNTTPYDHTTPLGPHNGTQSTSPLWSLSALQYPFQTLDLYGNSFIPNPTQFNQLPPPLTPSYPMLEYLNFPETPGAPRSARQELGGMPINTSQIGTFGGEGYPTLSCIAEMGRTDGWDMFRTTPAEARLEDTSLKRKRGRPRCSFAQVVPKPMLPSAASTSSSNSTPATTAPLPRRDTQQIKTQGGLEAELKLAVNELNDRVRVILDRTTPDVARESGVSAILGEPEKDWHVAKAVINKVMGSIALPIAEPTPAPSTPLNQLPAEKPRPSRPNRAATYRGPWMPTEITRIREIVEKSYEKIEGVSMVNWTLVAETFGPTRSKHQILCKAVDLGLKGTTTTAGRRKRQKRHLASQSSSLRQSVRTSGEDEDGEDDGYTCATATSRTSSS